MAQIQQDNLEQEIQGLSKKEVFAFKQFENVYRVEHPEPRRPLVQLGLEFWTALTTSISAIILAAFRTGQAFYMAASSGQEQNLAIFEAVSAVFAIEGSVVLFAINRARRLKKLEDNSSEWGLWIAFIISALAGLFQSSSLLSVEAAGSVWFTNLLKWVLVFAMGLGASVIAFLGGDVLGVQLVRLESSRTVAKEQFIKAMNGWRANLLKVWKESDERLAVMSRKGSHYKEKQVHEPMNSQQFTNSSEGSRTQVQKSSRSPVHRGSRRGSGELNPPATKDEIYAIFDAIYSNEQRIAGVNDTARELAKRRNPDGSDDGWENVKGRVSGVRKQWMITRGLNEQ